MQHIPKQWHYFRRLRECQLAQVLLRCRLA